MKRGSGVLLPMFSLPSQYGIGCFSAEAYEFVNHLKAAGQSYWQMLPMGPIGWGASPYQPLSSFAGNPYYIDPARMLAEGLLTEADFKAFPMGADRETIDYDRLAENRIPLLRRAFSRFEDHGEIAAYEKAHSYWLDDFAVFMALKEKYGQDTAWYEWPASLRDRDPKAMAKVRKELAEEIAFFKWTQYEFDREWAGIVGYAVDSGISVIGDIPIYVSHDSADCWADRDLFLLDEEGMPSEVAGVPPDGFSPVGQLWGNPIYDWEAMEKTNFRWWAERVRRNFEHFQVLRLDHFRGYEAYYTVPAEAETALYGTWRTGPGMKLFKAISEAVENPQFIAEDLGFLTEEVEALRKETGVAGTKVLQFAFDGDTNNRYLPHTYGRDSIVYTGTHDNDTTKGWYEKCTEDEKRAISEYCGYFEGVLGVEDAVNALFYTAEASTADLCMIPMQDLLHFGSDARTNTPGTVGNNWDWRMPRNAFSEGLEQWMHRIAVRYARI